jgi:hypothetical protein
MEVSRIKQPIACISEDSAMGNLSQAVGHAASTYSSKGGESI